MAEKVKKAVVDNVEFEIEEDVDVTYTDEEADKDYEEEAGTEDKADNAKEEDDDDDENRVIPLRAHIAERKKLQAKYKELEQKLAKVEAEKAKISETELYEEYYNEFVESGFTDESAKRKAQREVKKDLELQAIKSALAKAGNAEDSSYEQEFAALKTEYDISDDVKDELIEEAERTGYSIEQVYSALYGGKKKLTAEEKRLTEQRLLAENSRKRKASVDITKGSVRPVKQNTDYGLTQDQKDMARLARMSVKDYAELINADINAESYGQKKLKKKE